MESDFESDKQLARNVMDRKIEPEGVSDRFESRLCNLEIMLDSLRKELLEGLDIFFFYEWEHRTGTMCPFSSLHPLKKGKEV